jgi:hypothetical protein
MLALKELLHNLKDRDWDVNPTYSIDENEARRIIEGIEAINKWILVKFRPLTNEEQKEYPNYCYMADCPMPDDGEEILVSTKHGSVEKDWCGFDDGYYLDSGHDWQTDIVAWMPLPQPYKAESEEEK